MDNLTMDLLPPGLQRARPSLDGLPIELLEKIVRFGDFAVRDFFALQRQCRILRRFSEAYIYSSYGIDVAHPRDMEKLARFMWTVGRQQGLAKLVKSITIRLSLHHRPAMNPGEGLAFVQSLLYHERIKKYRLHSMLVDGVVRGDVDVNVAMLVMLLPNLQSASLMYGDSISPTSAGHIIQLLDCARHHPGTPMPRSLRCLTLVSELTGYFSYPTLTMNADTLFCAAFVQSIVLKGVIIRGPFALDSSLVTNLTLLEPDCTLNGYFSGPHFIDDRLPEILNMFVGLRNFRIQWRRRFAPPYRRQPMEWFPYFDIGFLGKHVANLESLHLQSNDSEIDPRKLSFSPTPPVVNLSKLKDFKKLRSLSASEWVLWDSTIPGILGGPFRPYAGPTLPHLQHVAKFLPGSLRELWVYTDGRTINWNLTPWEEHLPNLEAIRSAQF